MKDRENVLRLLDEIDNAIMVINSAVDRGMPLEPSEVMRRFNVIRQKLQTVTDRVSGS